MSIAFPTPEDLNEIVFDWKPYFVSFACVTVLPVTSSGISKWHQI